MKYTIVFNTSQPFIYHLYISLKPIICISCHITFYRTPLAAFNFDQSSSHDRFRYNSAPSMPPLYSFKANMMHFMSYNVLYVPPKPLAISIKLQQRIAFRYSFKINLNHLCIALKPILCILCHRTSDTTTSASLNFDQASSTYSFRYTLKINIVNVRQAAVFDTPQPFQPLSVSIKLQQAIFF